MKDSTQILFKLKKKIEPSVEKYLLHMVVPHKQKKEGLTSF